jgi:polyisoprenoid-binding protein YceI
MKKVFFLILIGIILSQGVFAQRYLTKTGKISFFSKTALENIEAHNNQVNSALDTKTGDFVFKVLMKSFEFEKALMQEHFNENYVESDKFPNATLKGKVNNVNKIDFSKNGSYNAEIEGDLTIHGVTQSVKVSGTFEVKDGKVNGKSKFTILLADYEISVPSPVVDNIAKEIEITVDVMLEKVAE